MLFDNEDAPTTEQLPQTTEQLPQTTAQLPQTTAQPTTTPPAKPSRKFTVLLITTVTKKQPVDIVIKNDLF